MRLDEYQDYEQMNNEPSLRDEEKNPFPGVRNHPHAYNINASIFAKTLGHQEKRRPIHKRYFT